MNFANTCLYKNSDYIYSYAAICMEDHDMPQS